MSPASRRGLALSPTCFRSKVVFRKGMWPTWQMWRVARAAEFGNADLTAKAFQHDADLLFGRMVPTMPMSPPKHWRARKTLVSTIVAAKIIFSEVPVENVLHVGILVPIVHCSRRGRPKLR